MNVDSRNVVPRGQSGFEEQSGSSRLGDQYVADKNPDVAGRGGECVDTYVWIAGVDKDLLILLVPGVHAIPIECDVLTQIQGTVELFRVGPDGVLGPAIPDLDRPIGGVTFPRAMGGRRRRDEEFGTTSARGGM